MRKLFVAPAAALLLASCVTQRSTEVKPAGNPTVPNGPVAFKDTNLEAVVRAALKKPQGVITRKEIASLETLKANNAGISDLTGLEYATNLTNLALYTNKVTTLGPLATLTKLTNLSLLDNQITDLVPLAKLPKLKWLALNDNRVTDVAPLAGLSSLAKLYLGNNKISTIAPLADLTKLTRLYLHQNQITDASPLAKLTGLKVLTLGGNAINESQKNMLKEALPDCIVSLD